MRSVLAAFCLALCVGSATAKPPAPAPIPASQAASSASHGQLIEPGHYVNSDGQVIHSPAHTVDGSVPAGASARCGDGTYSFSTHRGGTCSHHGGVATWL